MPISRNTPAYAGKTLRPTKRSKGSRKHPRLRGEDGVLDDERTEILETPPLTRGRPDEIALEASSFGNTPAYAGKTWLRRFPERAQPETPPLTRGRLDVGLAPREHVGNTPAYAGKTSSRCSEPSRPEKHPRLRGEDGGSAALSVRSVETPPLTRGRRIDQIFVSKPLGNTPAYAGKTSSATMRASTASETPPLTRGRHDGRSPDLPI